MKDILHVGVVQMAVTGDTDTNLERLECYVNALMKSFHKPELVIGVEGGIGYHVMEPIPGPTAERLCTIAKKHGIYLVPGSMSETDEKLGDGEWYNSIPVINPQGEIIAVYRKICPWYPEETSTPGHEYVVFPIPEKDTIIGVSNCYDLSFPEISRNLALMGAEVIIRPAMDPEPLYRMYKHVIAARAVENQAYYLSINACGIYGSSTNYGHSTVVDPEANFLWEAGKEDSFVTVPLDLGLVRRSREHGTMYKDHLLRHLRLFKPMMPYAANLEDAPLYRIMDKGNVKYSVISKKR
ncbi:MAG: Nitrilase/cyanide hydratase and apolipoprotein N-acyltransferase [Brevibacillus sp.]|nr:Nitrilase/cyanide hydratase and apolipoprotein N-acyltransferase [Brevibacillus sp.]